MSSHVAPPMEGTMTGDEVKAAGGVAVRPEDRDSSVTAPRVPVPTPDALDPDVPGAASATRPRQPRPHRRDAPTSRASSDAPTSNALTSNALTSNGRLSVRARPQCRPPECRATRVPTTRVPPTGAPTAWTRDSDQGPGAVVLQFPGAGRPVDGVEPVSPASTSFGLADAPTGRRVRARLARFNAPWQTPQVSEVARTAHRRPTGPPTRRRTPGCCSGPTTRPTSGTPVSSASPATRTSPIRSRWRRSSPNLGMTPPPWSPPCCTTRSRTPTTRLDQMREDFGDEVALLVDGVTKLDKVKLGDAAQGRDHPQDGRGDGQGPPGAGDQARRPAAQHAHLALPAAEPKQERKARETLEIYAPLAHRLGMNTIKWELEDLAFATLYPKATTRSSGWSASTRRSATSLLGQVTEKVGADLRAAKIKAEVTGRPKHYYSIYQKMIVRGRDFADIYDLVGRAGPGRHGPRLLRGPGRASTRTGSRCRAGSRTTSRCRSSTCTSRCTRR